MIWGTRSPDLERVELASPAPRTSKVLLVDQPHGMSGSSRARYCGPIFQMRVPTSGVATVQWIDAGDGSRRVRYLRTDLPQISVRMSICRRSRHSVQNPES